MALTKCPEVQSTSTPHGTRTCFARSSGKAQAEPPIWAQITDSGGVRAESKFGWRASTIVTASGMVAALWSNRMHPLDNPIFNALGTCQENFAESYGVLRRFPPEVTPLGGF